MTNADNNGLDIPIDAIASIVTDYQGRMSRADIWAIATLVAVEDSQDGNSEISFPLEWYGRTDCDSANGKTGPAQALPSPDLTTHQLLEFFTTDFGLSTRETVALMGAHTIGELNRENSGFNGPNGWSNNNARLNNGYYDAIIGGDEEDNTLEQTDFETLFNAPNWDFEEVNNSAFPGIPNRRVWTRGGNGNRQTLMLNSDMALVQDLSGHVDPSTGEVGEVTCRFKGRRSPCPHAQQTFDIAAEFKYDFDQWRIEFRDVLGKMLLAGNDTTATCSSPPCQLP
jgi:catalase (peroxidase I)